VASKGIGLEVNADKTKSHQFIYFYIIPIVCILTVNITLHDKI